MTGPLAAGILVLALLFAGHSIFIALAFSLFIIANIWPLQRGLQRWMPKLLALLIALLVTMGITIVIGSSVVWGFGKLGHWLLANADRFQTTYLTWTAWLEQHGIAILGPLTDRFDVSWLVGVTQTIAVKLNSLAGSAVLVFIFVMLGLLEVDDFNARLLSPAVQPFGQRIVMAHRLIGIKLRRFMLVRTFASILTGFVVWLFALSAGLELASAWGAIAFALNYIPFLGPMVATALPTLFAIGQFESWQTALLIFASLSIIQFIIGSYLEPRLTGATLAISPFAVIFAVFFWSFMWGLPGAFIGVPILIAFTVYCACFDGTRWVAALLAHGHECIDVDQKPAGEGQ